MEEKIIKYSGHRKVRTRRNRKIFKIKYILLIALVFIGLGVLSYVLLPTISLKGKTNLVLNYKEKYKEKGYKAFFLGKDITKDVKVSGKVNSNKLGDYEITYSIKKGFYKINRVRKITVTDTSKPVIELENKEDIYVCPDTEYTGEKDEKYKAYDNYDGDLTKKVKVEKTIDELKFTVVDKHGNKKEVIKKILYEDHTNPVIELVGGTGYTFIGEKYNDRGYKATDNCDGDISNKVEVSGSVNTANPGEYTLTYKVTDKYGNKAEVNRLVIVNERGKNGVIYLTFDDGPKSGTTDVILDILKEEGVEATFFVTNNGPDELIKREYDEGHTVALHTASHDYAIVYASVDSYFNDLNSVSERVKRITGFESKVIRFPGGSSNTISRRYSVGIMSTLTSEVLRRGYRYYDWNISSGDAGGTTEPYGVYSNVINGLSRDRPNMVLMHDIKPYTRDAIREIIRYGKDNGYTFEKITPYTEMVTQRVNN